MVEYVLSYKSINMDGLAYLIVSTRPLAIEIQTLTMLFMQFGVYERGGVLDNLEVRLTFFLSN